MIERLHQLEAERKSFAFETTLSGLSYLQLLKKARQDGYKIILFFIWLENFRIAKSRVEVRVKHGGHNIPDDVIERRYKKGIQNFSTYTSVVNDWYVYDNSGKKYVLSGKSVNGSAEIFNFDITNKLLGNEC